MQGTGILAGQVAIVTGASQGIGRTIAEYLMSAGAAVALAARSADLLNNAVAAIQRVGGRAIAVPLDITDRRATMQLASAVEDRLGPIDLLVNNAGMDRVYGPMWEGDLDAWRQEFETNFFGPLLCTRAVVPGMVARGRGRIVNVASLAGTVPRVYRSAYGVSKTALIRLTETLAEEVAPNGISVFAIHPGRVLTPMNKAHLQAPDCRRWLPDLVRAVETGGLPWRSADDAGRLVVRLASGLADALSGCFLDVEQDDLDGLLMRSDEIRKRQLLSLRIVK
jgi:3-oxoacyl-[acyl-carrier protein] reductase